MKKNSVLVWEECVELPTYGIGEPIEAPMFLEKRVYQGSSGKVYPHPVIEQIYDKKEMKTYRAVFIENAFIKVMILPELGGRIHRAIDKTNNYDFIYYNQVVKPALVGLTGPWISGGIEFNWPQHHRPSTFDPVSHSIEEHEDGSATVWVGEVEHMFRTKGMAGFRLYPDKAYIEITGQLYNRTDQHQTFLWWANPAVAVNDYTRTIFPPDVYAVMDHGKRDVSSFPIATGTYYKVDYSEGVDISRYKNIPVPTSYMAYHSDYDFVGFYDESVQAGLIHVADHHVSPGKKQWTWGCGEFGQRWDDNLTDEDGPYVELMTGCFTDNQPDFSWMAPHEEKKFTQYFMPYKGIGDIKNATMNGAINVTINDQEDLSAEQINAEISLYVTGIHEKSLFRVLNGKECIYMKELSLSPESIEKIVLPLEKALLDQYIFELCDQVGDIIVDYKIYQKGEEAIPEPAKAIEAPEQIKTNEDLYLYGLHLEQYRHATFRAEDYYLEGLRRDETDYRINLAYGKLLMGRCQFELALNHFDKAINKITRSNPNPYDGEAYYQKGMVLRYMGKDQLAYDAFYKAVWNNAFKSPAYYHLASIDHKNGNIEKALEHIDRSLVHQWHNMKARHLKVLILKALQCHEEVNALIKETLAIDPMAFGVAYEKALLESTIDEWLQLIKMNEKSITEIAIDYYTHGAYQQGMACLELVAKHDLNSNISPLTYYYLAQGAKGLKDQLEYKKWCQMGKNASPKYCFPHRIEDYVLLKELIDEEELDGMLPYYLGNLLYDKRQHELALQAFELAIERKNDYYVNYRNLSLLYYNHKKDKETAYDYLQKAYQLSENDPRMLMELDQLKKRMGITPQQRYDYLKEYQSVVEQRDDLYLEYLTLMNLTGHQKEAYDKIMNRVFHPWEGGEGKVPMQYKLAGILTCLEDMEADHVIEILTTLTGSYPHNLGEGKLFGTIDNHCHYYLGRAHQFAGNHKEAREAFEKAASGEIVLANSMFYNDQPPEMLYYKGLAYRALENEVSATTCFNALIDYYKKHKEDQVKVDYFAVSLPDIQLFEDDLTAINYENTMYLGALGYMGMGNHDEAKAMLEAILEKNPSHQGAYLHMNSWN